jgi:DNA polymerase-3 subunit gamma/tau
MGYLVLARKWRPQTWDEVVAQKHVTATLRNAIQYNRIAHAYLLTGPRGVGKTSAARIMAKALNCEKGATPDPCNTCSSCQEITGGRSLDVVEIDGASNRSIDDIRSLRETVRYAPNRGRFRVYIIDEVHMLTTEAFNALLKTLEEPPEHVLFIFATTEPHKVPATIISRCQRFDFHRIGVSEMVALLKHICEIEKIDADEEALHLIARKADGSLRDSQSILDQMISFTSNKIQIEDVVKALGLIDQQLFFDATDSIRSKDATKAFELVEQIVASGTSIEEFLIGLSEHFRNLLVVRATGHAKTLEMSDVHRKRYEEKAGDFSEEDLLRLLRITTEAIFTLKFSANPRIPLELAMVKMVKLDGTVAIGELLTQLADLKKKPFELAVAESKSVSYQPVRPVPVQRSSTAASSDSVPNPKSAAPASPTATPGSQSTGTDDIHTTTLEEVKACWDDIIAQVKRKKITVGAFLQEGTPVAVRGNVIEVGFAQGNSFHVDAITRAQTIILEVMKDFFGRDVQFKCLKGDFPQRKRITEKERKIETVKVLEEQGGIIKKLIEDFDVEVES